jgi:hypothetical protein
MTTKYCPQCGNKFEGRANKLYCSIKCKMAAFYSSDGNSGNGLPFNGISNEKPGQTLTDNKLSVNQSEKPLTVPKNKNEPEMETIPVFFTTAEKENLEKQAQECETVLSKLIRIRCLMDETDIRTMQQIITKQEQQIEELRIKLGFFQEKGNPSESFNQFTEKSGIMNLVKMNQKQFEFLREKYLESHDFESSGMETLPDGTITSNERDALVGWERKYPDYIITTMGVNMLNSLFNQIEERLVEHCGWDEEELQDDPLIEKFDSIK